MTGRRTTLSMIAGALAITIGASVAMADPVQVNISGATLFKNFFSLASATNDAIDVNNNGLKGFWSTDPYVEQLAKSYTDSTSWWLVNYRGVGSGNGLSDLRNFYDAVNGTPRSGVSWSALTNPTDNSYINRTQYYAGSGGVGPYNPANPGSSPVPINQIDIAIMDVPTRWFVRDTTGTAAWSKKPGQVAYGNNSRKNWDTNTQSNALKDLSPLNLNLASPNTNTVYDAQIAWVPIAMIANRGTGLDTVRMSDLQYLFVTGRRANGENLQVGTRDPGSGTRNAAMNSIGVDPSWGIGDNLGTKTADGAIALGYMGATHQITNTGGSSNLQAAVRHTRLAVAYAGLMGGVADTDAQAGRYEVLSVIKDINDPSNATPVRPSLDNVLDNTDYTTGWQIGGAETMATVGDPNAAVTGNPAIRNLQAAEYILNITGSIADFITNPSGVTENYMPGQALAEAFTLNASIDALPSLTDPTVFQANPALVQKVQNWTRTHNSLTLGDYGSVNTAGLVPIRTVLTTGTYNDGSTGVYTDSCGQTLDGSLNLRLASRNRIAGDFNFDGKRDWNDIDSLVAAVRSPSTFEASKDWGGSAFDHGDQLHNAVCVQIIGDFNSDGNFDKEDVRYFADGLALDPVSGKLNRNEGFTRVDQASLAHGGALNYFGTTVASGKAYQAGASRGDVTGPSVTNQPGAKPMADGVINVNDLRYIKKNFGTWASLDSASKIDLSCDMNGDLVVDYNDVVEWFQYCFGSGAGDINLDGFVNVTDLQALVAAWASSTGGAGWNAEADINGDGFVNVGDLQLLVATWGMGS